MILIRKILVPVISMIALLLVGLLFYVYSTYQTVNNEEERKDLITLKEAYGSELENQEILALSIALEVASNPTVQEAFANRDRAALLDATAPSFQRLKEFGVYEYQFHTPQSVSFLRVNNPELFGDDLSVSRPLIAQVNSNQTQSVAMELAPGGLGLRGIVPVFYQNEPIGSFEVAVAIDKSTLDHFVSEYGNEWHILLTQESVLTKMPQDLLTMQAGPVENLLLYASTSETPLYSLPSAYTQTINEAQDVVEEVEINEGNYAILTTPILDYTGTVIGVLEIVNDRTEITTIQNTRLATGGIFGILVLLLGSVGVFLVTTRALEPISRLTKHAQSIKTGEKIEPIDVVTNDEIGELASAFNIMTLQIQDSISTLEQAVDDRTRNLQRRTLELETVADVAREIATIRNMDTLLNVAADLIRVRFNFYQVGIFLVDGRSEYAVLRAASGSVAQQLLDKKHKLKVGVGSIVGNVTRSGQAHIAQDVRDDAVHFQNPLLTETRSEIGLPLRSRSTTIGALNIQSKEVSAFDVLDIQTLQLLADQLSAAIENAELVQQVEGAISELNKTYRAQTLNVWQAAISERERPAFEYDGQYIKPIPHYLLAEQVKQLEAGKPIIVKGTAEHDEVQNTLLVPLLVLNQVIGVIGLEQEDPNHTWTEEEITVVEAAANRAALALENARLLEESQRRAVKERAISEAASRIGAALNIENILYTTAEEIERVLGNSDVTLQINTETQLLDDKDGLSGAS